MSVSKKYQKLEQREHVLKKPGMYIGSIESDENILWVFDNTICQKNIEYIPGLYKIYDEIIVNSLDHVIRIKDSKKPVKEIKVTIKDNVITVYNNGEGIEVEKHDQHKIYIPELIFGNMLTSTNYDDNEQRIIGGTNGIGSKACNIFSESFIIETADGKKKYYQEFMNNMSEKNEPEIEKYTKYPFTKIKFKPDYKKFGVKKLSYDMESLMKKRVYDMCALTPQTVKVYLNDEEIKYKNFEKYIDLYLGTSRTDYPRVFLSNDRWELCITYSDEGFKHVSFVNGIWTMKGGKHVDYIVNQVTKKLSEMIKKRRKADVKQNYLKDNLFVFIKSTINNPTFDSQTKETLTTPYSKFGSKCDIDEKTIEKIYKLGFVDKVITLSTAVENKESKKSDGRKSSVIRGIVKLDDANNAGTSKSSDCTLILTEGDSAKSSAISGLSVVGRSNYGVFPLKGKVMNVKDMTLKRINENEEISNLKKILGLESGKKYKSIDELRYGKIMVMTDADVDGSHIKGLLFNLFQSLWPSLLKIDGFMSSLLTPIVKATKGKQMISFYNLTDYEKWKDENKGWNIKYFKGLGTSSSQESKDYFKNMKKINYTWNDESEKSIELAFNKKKADDRKDWLYGYNKDNIIKVNSEDNITNVEYSDFIHKELIHFSDYSIQRAIPNICDGLKTSQRKILFSCFKKKLYNEIKVAQLAGYVSENSSYHHGENSLQEAIIAMAQDFVGSNNINLLMPKGQFGCVHPETEIILWDSTIKKAKDIVIGDKLIGDDGLPRIVSKTIKNQDTMYKIKNGDMIDYIVNKNHILTCCLSEYKNIYWDEYEETFQMIYYDREEFKYKVVKTQNKTKKEAYDEILKFYESLPEKLVFDINLQEYLKLPYIIKKNVKGIVNSTVIKWNQQITEKDPYIIGYESKNISKEYILNSEENRLKLLAGAIDKNGMIKDGQYVLKNSYKNNNYLESLRIVASSLGYKAKYECFKLKISGNNLKNIPVKNHKLIEKIDDKYMLNNIEIEELGYGDYCGWHINSNERFLLGDFTITHNTRIQGGKDSASPRYIYTQLNNIVRYLYHVDDFEIIKYLEDDGMKIEPLWYIPIIPMILVNGTVGIGTGFSTSIPCYNPKDIIKNIKLLLEEKEQVKIEPYYKNHKGQNPSKGVFKKINATKIEITELPVGIWTEDFKSTLETYIDKNPKILKNYENHYTETDIKFILQFGQNEVDKMLEVDKDGITLFEKEFKLINTRCLSTTNMHLYDAKGVIRKFSDVNDIIKYFYKIRKEMYRRRKENKIHKLENDITFLDAKIKFIQEVIDETLKIMNIKKQIIIEYLENNEYPKQEDNYDYLIKMPIQNLTYEKREELEKEADMKHKMLEEIKGKTVITMYEEDLKEFEKNL